MTLHTPSAPLSDGNSALNSGPNLRTTCNLTSIPEWIPWWTQDIKCSTLISVIWRDNFSTFPHWKETEIGWEMRSKSKCGHHSTPCWSTRSSIAIGWACDSFSPSASAKSHRKTVCILRSPLDNPVYHLGQGQVIPPVSTFGHLSSLLIQWGHCQFWFSLHFAIQLFTLFVSVFLPSEW